MSSTFEYDVSDAPQFKNSRYLELTFEQQAYVARTFKADKFPDIAYIYYLDTHGRIMGRGLPVWGVSF